MKFSWNLIQTFESVAKTGSLLAASRALGISQPTVGRHIDMLEQVLGLSLFVRSREGMALTPAGERLVSSATDVVASAQTFERTSLGQGDGVTGVVRVSANDILGVYTLPKLIAAFRDQHPDIQVELDISNSAANLSRRDADIAVRMFRPLQNDLLARKVTSLPLGFYAHSSLVARHGQPAELANLADFPLVGFDRETLHIDAARAMGATLQPTDFDFRSDSLLAQIEAVKAGLGIGVLHQGMAASLDGIERILPDTPLPQLDVWLVCHTEVRYSARIRLLFDFLAENLRNPYATPRE